MNCIFYFKMIKKNTKMGLYYRALTWRRADVCLCYTWTRVCACMRDTYARNYKWVRSIRNRILATLKIRVYYKRD